MDIAKAHGRVVDPVFALPRAVEPSGHGDFLIGSIQSVVAVVKCNGDRGKALRLSCFGPGKNDILHVPAAQLLCALFTEDPSDRIRDIGFSAAVRTDDPGDALMEVERHFVGEGLEALHFYLL